MIGMIAPRAQTNNAGVVCNRKSMDTNCPGWAALIRLAKLRGPRLIPTSQQIPPDTNPPPTATSVTGQPNRSNNRQAANPIASPASMPMIT